MFENIDQTAVTRTIPAGWRPGSEGDGNGGGVITSAPQHGAPLTRFEDIIREFGYDPAEVEVVGGVRHSRWQIFDGSWLTSYRITLRARTGARADLPALFAASRRKPRKPLKPATEERATVVVLADLQIGKSDSRGGTADLVDRLAEKRAAVDAELKRRKPSRAVLVDAGDIFEGFQSGAGPLATAFSNDLSLSQQMDLAGTVVYDFAETLQRHAPTDVLAVPSNHTAWRAGKQNLGRPADDMGLYVHKQTQRLATAAGLRAQWHMPADYDQALVLDVLGTGLGVAHGHQYGQGGAAKWWAGQIHGGQALASADILLTGHYHHLSILPTGRNPYTGRSKWWIQAPTLDAGSSWYRHRSGDDSDPGLLIFDITPDGFDLRSLAVL